MLAVLILAGCGGSGADKVQWRTVTAPGYRFQAPVGWTVTVGKGRTTVRHGQDLVQVASFPLVHPYDDALFDKVRTELETRMATVATESGGTVAGHHVVTVSGIRSHSYDVRVGKRVDRYTFVLRGKRELLLLCAADGRVCDELAASFVAG